MKRLRIYLSLFLILIISQSCGFKPIYSSANLDIKINEIEYEPNILNKQVVQTLGALSNPEGTREYNVRINTLKEKNIVSKNSKGETETYEIKIILQFEVYNDNFKNSKNFTSKIKYSNNDNNFELNQYEMEIEKQIINDLIEEIIFFFSSL